MATPYSPLEVIEIAKRSQYYASKAVGRGSLFSPELSPKLPMILYMERKILEKAYDTDSAISTLQNVANYVYRLCGRFGARAVADMSAGGSGGIIVVPTTSNSVAFNFQYLIPISASDFATATEYNDSRIAGRQLEVFWQQADRYLEIGTELLYTPTGFSIFINDGSGGNSFNSQTTNAGDEFKIYIVNPVVNTSTPSSSDVQSYPYSGVGGELYFEDVLLKNKTMLMVLRGLPSGIIYSGTPTGTQVLYTANIGGKGRLTFAATNPIATNEFIIVLYK